MVAPDTFACNVQGNITSTNPGSYALDHEMSVLQSRYLVFTRFRRYCHSCDESHATSHPATFNTAEDILNVSEHNTTPTNVGNLEIML